MSDDSRVLVESDYWSAASKIGCSVATIKAVAEVESAGDGFLPDGRPTILYEAHVFHRLTCGKFPAALDRFGVPLSVPNWNRGLYGQSGAHQYLRLADAMMLAAPEAQQSCSWGMFQVMGFNWGHLRYNNLGDFLHSMRSASGQLDGFVRFIRVSGLAKHLIDRNWAEFARRYNGPAYAKNAYDAKMAAAYTKFAT